MTPEHQAAETALRVALAKIAKIQAELSFWRGFSIAFVGIYTVLSLLN